MLDYCLLQTGQPYGLVRDNILLGLPTLKSQVSTLGGGQYFLYPRIVFLAVDLNRGK